MEEITISGDIQKIARSAGTVFATGIKRSKEDAQFGLKYPLKRLAMLGLITDEEANQLRALQAIIGAIAGAIAAWSVGFAQYQGRSVWIDYREIKSNFLDLEDLPH